MLKEIYYRLQKTVQFSGIASGDKILDLGCGKNCPLLEFLPKNIEYTGIDIKKTREKNVIKHDLERGLPRSIMNKKFDIIFILELLEHIENFRTLVMQCEQILSEKGRIIISTPSNMRLVVFLHGESHEHIHCFRKTNLNNLARICGLKMTGFGGTFIRIPILHTLILSDQTWYTDFFLVKFEKDK